MKKISIILFTVFLNLGFQSCSLDALNEDANLPQACCGEDDQIPPPPPPPPGGGNG